MSMIKTLTPFYSERRFKGWQRMRMDESRGISTSPCWFLQSKARQHLSLSSCWVGPPMVSWTLGIWRTLMESVALVS
jgi:hypothetical protein